MAAEPVLALNCGSSSLKFGVYDAKARLLLEGESEEIGGPQAKLWIAKTGGSRDNLDASSLRDHESVCQFLFARLNQSFRAVGHRFVHGGPHLRQHTLLDPKVRQQLDLAAAFAPLHLPASLAVLDAVQAKLPDRPQAICLDTAFHVHMPDVARTYPFPPAVREAGIERYGFHGLSLESIVQQLENVPERLVVAHLGNGASITAIQQGKSIDTTMGLTPAGGVMMGTRCGDLDPGVMIYLLRDRYELADQLEDLFNRRSGLRAVSGLTSDVRELQAARSRNEQADLALRMFCYQVRKAIASMAAALNGLDLLVFTGGIGEHDEAARDEICAGLSFLNFRVAVLPSQEDAQIAQITNRLLMDRS